MKWGGEFLAGLAGLGLLFLGLLSLLVGVLGFFGRLTSIFGISLTRLDGSFVGLAVCAVIGIVLICIGWAITR